jgi:hypothetical protein
MKTENEILATLEELKSEFLELEETYINGAEKYKRGEYVWGKEEDEGELDYILKEYIKVHDKIELLEWVLDKKCPCGVSIGFDIELCPTCADKLQVEMYEDQLLAEEESAEAMLNMLKEDPYYYYDGPL